MSILEGVVTQSLFRYREVVRCSRGRFRDGCEMLGLSFRSQDNPVLITVISVESSCDKVSEEGLEVLSHFFFFSKIFQGFNKKCDLPDPRVSPRSVLVGFSNGQGGIEFIKGSHSSDEMAPIHRTNLPPYACFISNYV